MTTRREVNAAILSTVAAAAMPAVVLAQGAPQATPTVPQTIELPPPVTDGGAPLMQALKNRRSIRDYADRPLAPQVLSNLLWAAWGVNRPASDGRTAPHWRNIYALDIYLTMADGVRVYEPKSHRLQSYMTGDLRGLTTTGQDFVATAPINLVYAFDTSKMGHVGESEKTAAAAACAAVVAQNVYLYCASEGLATVLRQSVPGEKLAQALKLPAGQIIQFAQTVGYPKA